MRLAFTFLWESLHCGVAVPLKAGFSVRGGSVGPVADQRSQGAVLLGKGRYQFLWGSLGLGKAMSDLPMWASEVISGYESGVAGCFVLHGNTGDRQLMPGGENFPGGERLGSLRDFLGEVLLPRFEIVLVYDLGEGLRVQRGEEKFEEWAGEREVPSQPLATMRYVGKVFALSAKHACAHGEEPAGGSGGSGGALGLSGAAECAEL